MKNAILKFLVSRAGGVLTPIVSVIVGLVVAKIAAMDSTLGAQVDQVAVTGFVVTGILSLVNYYTNAQSSDGVKSIQAIVGSEQDGVPGPKTFIEVRRATGIR